MRGKGRGWGEREDGKGNTANGGGWGREGKEGAGGRGTMHGREDGKKVTGITLVVPMARSQHICNCKYTCQRVLCLLTWRHQQRVASHCFGKL